MANFSVGIDSGPWLAYKRCIMFGRYGLYNESEGSVYSAAALLDIFDLTAPGATCITEIPKGLHSIFITSLREYTAALVAQYIPFQGVGLMKI